MRQIFINATRESWDVYLTGVTTTGDAGFVGFAMDSRNTMLRWEAIPLSTGYVITVRNNAGKYKESNTSPTFNLGLEVATACRDF